MGASGPPEAALGMRQAWRPDHFLQPSMHCACLMSPRDLSPPEAVFNVTLIGLKKLYLSDIVLLCFSNTNIPATYSITLDTCTKISQNCQSKRHINKSRAIAGRTALSARCRWKFRYYRILQRHRAVSLPQHGFFCIHQRPFTFWNRTQYADFQALAQNDGDSRKSRHTTKITAKATVILNSLHDYLTALRHVTISGHDYVH